MSRARTGRRAEYETVLAEEAKASQDVAEGNLELRKELFKDLYLNVRFFGSFDNRAEGTGATKNDLGTTTSFGWSF